MNKYRRTEPPPLWVSVLRTSSSVAPLALISMMNIAMSIMKTMTTVNYMITTTTPVATGAVTGSVRPPATSATASVRMAGSPAALRTAAPQTPPPARRGSAVIPVSASPPSVTLCALLTTPTPAAALAQPPLSPGRPGSAARTASPGPSPALGSVQRGSSHVAQSAGGTMCTDTRGPVAGNVYMLTQPAMAAVNQRRGESAVTSALTPPLRAMVHVLKNSYYVGRPVWPRTPAIPCVHVSQGPCLVGQQEYWIALQRSALLNSAKPGATQNPSAELTPMTTSRDVLRLVSSMIERQGL